MSEQTTVESRRSATGGAGEAPSASGARRTASRAAARTTSAAGEQGRQVASAARGQSRQVADLAAERGRGVVEASKSDAREVVGTAREQASQVKQELAEQGRNLLDQSRSQLQVQAQTQTERLADSVRRLGMEAEALAEGRPEEAGSCRDLAQQAAERLQGWADDLETRGVQGVVDDLTDFARQRPGAFLVGAAAVGFAMGRLLRNGAASGGGSETGELEQGSVSVGGAGRRTVRARAG